LYILNKSILESMRRRARMMTDGFNSCRNIVCNFTEGKIRVLNFNSLQQLNYYNYILITEL
jgi:hypothetical protein